MATATAATAATATATVMGDLSPDARAACLVDYAVAMIELGSFRELRGVPEPFGAWVFDPPRHRPDP
ncbi:hypothetical protein ACFZBU_12980 [Embleya sp. NPDC008237]|uniref:hypothetical protein n=1 Tax=Embleya sp. NPDC008237 TaxID=3363978 RepID=UPI0036DFD71C